MPVIARAHQAAPDAVLVIDMAVHTCNSDRVVMENAAPSIGRTVEEFRPGCHLCRPAPALRPPTPGDARAREALEHYDRAIDRLQAADWLPNWTCLPSRHCDGVFEPDDLGYEGSWCQPRITATGCEICPSWAVTMNGLEPIRQWALPVGVHTASRWCVPAASPSRAARVAMMPLWRGGCAGGFRLTRLPLI